MTRDAQVKAKHILRGSSTLKQLSQVAVGLKGCARICGAQFEVPH